MRTTFVFLCLFYSVSSNGQKITHYIHHNDKKILSEYIRFLSIPNVSSDSANILKNAAFIIEMMKERGIPAELLYSETPGATPAVYGEVKTKGATRTLGFYAHYDGQPVSAEEWHPGLKPFDPQLITGPLETGGKIIGPYKEGDSIDIENRVTGRGSADDKAGIMAILNAYSALVQTGERLFVNIKFLFEGEEEVGSIHLGEIFRKHEQKLKADAWIIADGPRHISGRKTLSYGVRGDVNMALTLYGAKRPLHSGNYGNWAPNPAQMLVRLLATMKDDNGRVTIKDFYQDVLPLTPLELKAISDLPIIDEQLKKELGITQTEITGQSLAQAVMLPSLNINGIRSGSVGETASNIIPTKAEVVLDLRLVKGNSWERQVQKVVAHIKSKGYHVINCEPTEEERNRFAKLIKIQIKHGYNAQRTSMDLNISKIIKDAVQSVSNEPIIAVPSSGGSLPLYLFEEILKTPVITVAIVNYDNNQHAENENVKIQFLWEGIETLAAIMGVKWKE